VVSPRGKVSLTVRDPSFEHSTRKIHLAFLRKEYAALTRGVLEILGIRDLVALDDVEKST